MTELRIDERPEVATEIAAAAALVRKSMAEDGEYLSDDDRAASEALAVVLEKTAANFGRIPAGVALATLALARLLPAFFEDEAKPTSERAPGYPPAPHGADGREMAPEELAAWLAEQNTPENAGKRLARYRRNRVAAEREYYQEQYMLRKGQL